MSLMWVLGIVLGVIIGMIIEWFVWYDRCKKKCLFNKDGSLKNLNKKMKK